MICGVGLDICEVSRMEKAIAHPRFLERIFSEAEREYLKSKGSASAQTAAGLYAAKEAYLKARGTGIDSLNLNRVEIAHGPQGQPYYRLSGAYADSGLVAHLSVSHDGGIAAAVCVLEDRGYEAQDG